MTDISNTPACAVFSKIDELDLALLHAKVLNDLLCDVIDDSTAECADLLVDRVETIRHCIQRQLDDAKAARDKILEAARSMLPIAEAAE